MKGDPGRLPGWSAHDRFGTAVQAFPEGTLHIGMARRERYPAPGALPVVAPGTLLDDLARRDVTVNAMAVPLGGPDAGRLIDPHGGRGDLDAHLIRSLRADAFEEDPSRLVRAARYAGRLGFLLEADTEQTARRVACARPAIGPGGRRAAAASRGGGARDGAADPRSAGRAVGLRIPRAPGGRRGRAPGRAGGPAVGRSPRRGRRRALPGAGGPSRMGRRDRPGMASGRAAGACAAGGLASVRG